MNCTIDNRAVTIIIHQDINKIDEMGHVHFLLDEMGLDKMGLDEMDDTIL